MINNIFRWLSDDFRIIKVTLNFNSNRYSINHYTLLSWSGSWDPWQSIQVRPWSRDLSAQQLKWIRCPQACILDRWYISTGFWQAPQTRDAEVALDLLALVLLFSDGVTFFSLYSNSRNDAFLTVNFAFFTSAVSLMASSSTCWLGRPDFSSSLSISTILSKLFIFSDSSLTERFSSTIDSASSSADI